MRIFSTLLLFSLAAVLPAHAEPMRTSVIRSPPLGYVQFCKEWPDECKTSDKPFAPVVMTKDKWNELLTVNLQVNDRIAEYAEAEGLDEWRLISQKEAYPFGDCEEFVLLKRKMLIDRGWHPGGLLITTGWRTLNGKQEGHAVLTVRTAKEDYILDNVTSEILPWRQTPHEYVRRQEELNPNWWTGIDPDPVLVLLPQVD